MENEITLQRKKRNRHLMIESLPISSYNTLNWFLLFKNFYKSINGVEYNDSNLSTQKICVDIATSIYPKIFSNPTMFWSAREFAFFMKLEIERTKNKNTYGKFTLFTLNNNRDQRIINAIIERHNIKLQEMKSKSKFERMVYLRHYDLPSVNHKIMDIFERIEDDGIAAFLYNYGIPNYVRYHQLKYKNKMSFKEARIIVGKKIFNFYNEMILENEHIVEKLFEGFFRTSILWEPYKDDRGGEYSYKLEVEVMDWRKDFEKIINKFKFKEKKWWKERYQTEFLPSIKSMNLLYAYK